MDNVSTFEQITRKTTFEDTTLYYSLYSDSLVLEYKTPPKVKHWFGEVFLVNKNYDSYINVHFPNHSNELLGKIEFENNRAVLDGFHIPTDSIEIYKIQLRASPHFPGCRAIGDLYGPAFQFISDDSSNQFKVSEHIKDFEITLFDKVKMKNLPKEQREFCQDSIENAFGIWITDAEIAEASYDW